MKALTKNKTLSSNSVHKGLYHKAIELSYKNNILIVGFDTEFSSKNDEVISYQCVWYDTNGNKQVLFKTPNEKYELDEFLELLHIEVQKTIKVETRKLTLYLMSHYLPAEIGTFKNFNESFNETITIKDNDDKERIIKNSYIKKGKTANFSLYTKSKYWKEVHFFDTLNYQKSKLEKIGEGISLKKIPFQETIELIYPEYKNYNYKAIEDFKKLLNDPKTRQICIDYAMRDAEISLNISLVISLIAYEKIVEKHPKTKFKVYHTVPSVAEDIFIKLFIDTKIAINDKTFSLKQQNYLSMGLTRQKFYDELSNTSQYCYTPLREIKDVGESSYLGGRNTTFFNGIVRNMNVFDYDLTNAYGIPLSLLKKIKIRKSKNGNILDSQSIVFSNVKDYKKYVKDFDFEKLISMIGSYSGEIVYKKGLIATPTMLDGGNFLCETRIANNTFALLELNFMLFFCPHIVDWEQTEINKITVIPTTDEYVFKDYVEMCIAERNKYPKNHIYNHMWKLFRNSLYGKLVQGVSKKINIDLFNNENREKLPPSNIYSPHYGSYITAFVRLLTFEAITLFENNKNKNFIVLNVITDGILTASNGYSNEEIIKKLNDLPFNKKVREITHNESIWELKHAGKGCFVAKTRVDGMTEIHPDYDESFIKCASPSAYSYDGSNWKKAKELKDMFLNFPNKQVEGNRLESIKDVIYNNGRIIRRIDESKIINWNIQLSKRVEEFINNENLQGVFLGLYDTIQELDVNYDKFNHTRNRNKFLAYDETQIKRYIAMQDFKDLRIYNNNEFNVVMSEIIKLFKILGINITYKKLPLNQQNQVLKQTFKNLKLRNKNKDLNIKASHSIWGKLYINYLEEILDLNNWNKIFEDKLVRSYSKYNDMNNPNKICIKSLINVFIK